MSKIALFLLLSAIGSIGCTMNDKGKKISDSVSGLEALIDIGKNVTSARWEIFDTPEQDDILPAPTDYRTLVAELQSTDVTWLDEMNKIPPTGFVAPGAARPWLSEPFRKMLALADAESLKSLKKYNCREYSTTLKQTKETVDGFLCFNSGRILMYLTVADFSK